MLIVSVFVQETSLGPETRLGKLGPPVNNVDVLKLPEGQL